MDDNNNPTDEAAGKKKKSRGRQKIDIKRIECRKKRKVTFSKRKANIIKKVYELHKLTDAQALVLLASSSGHIYTYATDKFKPMIKSDSGRQLIETCLNTPDNLQNDSEAGQAVFPGNGSRANDDEYYYEDSGSTSSNR